MGTEFSLSSTPVGKVQYSDLHWASKMTCGILLCEIFGLNREQRKQGGYFSDTKPTDLTKTCMFYLMFHTDITCMACYLKMLSLYIAELLRELASC